MDFKAGSPIHQRDILKFFGGPDLNLDKPTNDFFVSPVTYREYTGKPDPETRKAAIKLSMVAGNKVNRLGVQNFDSRPRFDGTLTKIGESQQLKFQLKPSGDTRYSFFLPVPDEILAPDNMQSSDLITSDEAQLAANEVRKTLDEAFFLASQHVDKEKKAKEILKSLESAYNAS